MRFQGQHIDHGENEEHILRRLGGAVVKQWDRLTDDARELVLRQSLNMTDRDEASHLEQEIKAFIAKHKL
jgi:hypothetical protein